MFLIMKYDFKPIILLLFIYVHGSYSINLEEYNAAELLYKTNFNNSSFMLSNNLKDKEFNFLQCYKDIMAIRNSITSQNMDLWTFELFDSSVKLLTGIKSGHIIDFGDFHECLNARKPNSSLQGKYCLLSIHIELPTNKEYSKIPLINNRHLFNSNQQQLINNEEKMALSFFQGICLPSSCSGDDIATILNRLPVNIVHFNIPEHLCQLDQSYQLTIADTVVIITGFIFFISGILCSILELLPNKFAKSKYVQCFSLYTNTEKLFNISNNNPRAITCLNGIRVLSIVWIVFCHKFFLTGFIPLNNNMLDTYSFMQTYSATLITGSTVSVDTFFVLSGFLLTFAFLRQIEKLNGKIPWLYFYLHRYIRLTIGVVVVLVFVLTIAKNCGQAPIWNSAIVDYLQNDCLDYWWSTLLYVQNYVNPSKVCIGSLWYLSVDLQLYILSPLILYSLWRWKRFGYYILIVLLIIAHVIVFTIVYIKRIPVKALNPMLVPSSEIEKWNTDYYQQTHMRASPWLFGVLLGYIMHNTVFPIRLNKVTVGCMWLLTIFLCITVVVGVHPFVQQTSEYDRVKDTLYLTFSRSAWAFGVCWMIFACHAGYGGPINWFLSLKMWLPLCKISYGVYLIHLIQLTMRSANNVNTSYFTVSKTFLNGIGDFILNLFLATCLYLFVESPLFTLETLTWKRIEKRKTQIPS